MRLVPFVPTHLADLEPPVMRRDELRRFTKLYVAHGPAFSILDRGRALGCGGIHVEGDVGRAWAVLSERIRRRPMVLHRAVRRGLDEISRAYGLRCLEATVHSRFLRGRAWLERLGFRQQGAILDRGGSGETYLRYVR